MQLSTNANSDIENALVACRIAPFREAYSLGGWELTSGAPISFRIGTCYSVTGPNMAGKSTLARIMCNSCNAPNRAMLLAHDDPMFPELSLWDNVRVSRPDFGALATASAKQRLAEFFNLFPTLGNQDDTSILGRLSSGGKGLIKLARPYVWGCSLLVVDEVTANLDENNAARFISSLKLFLEATAVVLISHQENDHKLLEKAAASVGSSHFRILLEKGARDEAFVVRHADANGNH